MDGFRRGPSGVPATRERRPWTAAANHGSVACSCALSVEVEEMLRLDGPEVTSQQIGLAVLDRLRHVDEVSYVRFASVYKGFEDPSDFEREVGLLTKAAEPKP